MIKEILLKRRESHLSIINKLNKDNMNSNFTKDKHSNPLKTAQINKTSTFLKQLNDDEKFKNMKFDYLEDCVFMTYSNNN